MSIHLNKILRSPFFLTALFLCGLSSIVLACWPLLSSFTSQIWQHYNHTVFPVVADDFLSQINNRPQILGDFTDIENVPATIITQDIDYGNLENWFADATTVTHQQKQATYTLEIPKLNIYNALVRLGGVNIDNNLVQFNSDAVVGEIGTPVIFGHSTMRQFYNPKESNKKRYKSIFSTIMTLSTGDLIYVTQGNVTYTYQVTEKKEVPADDDYILAQSSQARQLKLVTCTPEGTFLRRGVITAELTL